MKDQPILTLIEQLVEDLGQRPLTPDVAITELGIDSLAMGQIVLDLERRLGVSIPDSELADVVTIDDLVRVVEARLEESGRPLDAEPARN